MLLTVLIAQAYDYRDLFARTYGGRDDDWVYSVTSTSDGGFAMAGYTRSFGAGGSDILVLKLAATGELEWARTFGGTSHDYAYSVIQATDGGFVVAGYTKSFGAGGVDVLVIKLTTLGELEWARTFGGDGSEYGNSIVQATDGGFVVAGYREEPSENRTDPLVLRIDPSGDVDWAKTLAGSSSGYIHSISLAPDGYLVAGWTRSSRGDPDALVVKLGSSGGISWARTFGGKGYDWAFSVKKTTDGGYGVAGCISFGFYNFMILKLLASGEVDWVRTYGGPGWDAAFSLAQTTEGKVTVAGYTSSFGVGGDDVLVLRLGADGGYPGCVVECPLSVGIPSLSVARASLRKRDCSPTITIPEIVVGRPDPMVSDVCPPVPEDWPGSGE